MSRKIVMTLVCILVLGLSGCGDTLTLNQYNTSEIWYIAYVKRKAGDSKEYRFNPRTALFTISPKSGNRRKI